jgi:hypothetical protein
MTRSAFDALRQSEQVEVVYNDGVYIGNRQEPGFIIILYQIHDFYVEMFFFECELLDVKSFRSIDLLDPYLETIDISGIVY